MFSAKLMWFVAGAACMGIYLRGPEAILREGFLLGGQVSLWVGSFLALP